MDYLGYMEENLKAIAARKEFKRYAKENPFYAGHELEHALDVQKWSGGLWQERFEAIPPTALEGAAEFHDCDRFFLKEKLDTSKVPKEQYETAKIKHSKNCARIFRRENPKLPRPLKNDISYMIERHEVGGDKTNGAYIETADEFTKSFNLNVSSDQLTEADGISFFSVLLPDYMKWADSERVANKIRFSFDKLSPLGKKIVRRIDYTDKEVRDTVLAVIGES